MAVAYDRVMAGEKSGRFFGRGGLDDVTRIGTFLASDSIPFYVTVGYDEAYLARNTSDFSTRLRFAGSS
jgi:hypothetical protein